MLEVSATQATLRNSKHLSAIEQMFSDQHNSIKLMKGEQIPRQQTGWPNVCMYIGQGLYLTKQGVVSAQKAVGGQRSCQILTTRDPKNGIEKF